MSVATAQRFSKTRPCPICGGFDTAPRGTGQRCYGYLSNDSEVAHCTRQEYAGALTLHLGSDTFAHKLSGDCRCGVTHGPVAAPRRLAPVPTAPRRIVATYDYRDEQGQRLFQALRYDPKDFNQRRPDGRGGWIYNLEGVRRILYRLPELLAADRDAVVYLVEGEKDVDRLRNLGLVATCNPQGASKWRPEYGDFLRERHVVILPDNDDAGQRHAQQVATALGGTAADVRVLDLPGLPPKGDASDWLDAGGNVDQLVRLAAAAPAWEPPAAPIGCDTQDASHSERPNLTGVREEIVAYVRLLETERDGLWEENRTLRRERNEERDRYRLRLSVLRNRTIKPAARLAIVGLANELDHLQRHGEADKEAPHIFLAAVAEESGLSERTVGAHVEEIAQLGLCEKEMELHRKTQQTEDGKTRSVLYSELRIRPLDGSVTAMLRSAARIIGPERHHGGERKPLPKRCPDHPDAPIAASWWSACTVCGQLVDKGPLAHPPVSCDTQDASHSEAVEETFGCDAQDASPESSPPTGAVNYMHAQDASHSLLEAAADAWPPVEAEETPEAEAPDRDWAATFGGPPPPVPAVRAVDPEVERLRTELVDRQRKREGPALPVWKVAGVCLDCGGPLPPGSKYRCSGCVAFAAIGGES